MTGRVPALDFADRKTDGRYPVTDPSGAVVARIAVSFWTGRSFEADDGAGAPLCSGRKAGVFSPLWTGYDAAGEPLVSLRNSFWGQSRAVTLPDGRSLTLRGRPFARDWALTDDAGVDVLSSVPTTSAWSFRYDAWLVGWHDQSLDLATVVSIVVLNRLIVKAGRAGAAAANNAS